MVLPVVALACVGSLCPLWASASRLRPQWLDASDVGLVVAVVLLPLPVALLVHVLAGLLCVLVEHMVAQPMLLVVNALSRGARPAWGRLGLDRPSATVTVPLATAALGGVVCAAVQLVGGVLAWPALGLLCALAVVSRSRLRAQQEVQRLVHAARVLSSSAAGSGTPAVLATLDVALPHVGGVSGVRGAGADDELPSGWLSQDVPSDQGGGVRLLVRRPAETSSAGGSREDAVRALLRTGAQAYAMAEATVTLRHDLHHDGLPGVLNRTGLLARAEHELARARRNRLSAVVVYVDLDGFKAVNDLLGHAAGDRALRTAAADVSDLVRPHDVVARLGGDEFALLLLDLPTCRQAGEVVERVQERLSAGWPVGPGAEVRLSGSLGTACFPEDGDELGDLLRRADARRYARKRDRRAR